MPARMTFKTLPARLLPMSEAVGRSASNIDAASGTAFIRSVIERWRGAALGYKPRQEEFPADAEPVGFKEVPVPGVRLDQLRTQILRR
jgi:hypothetical protein